MVGMGLIDFENYRVRLPKDLFPYHGSHIIEIRHFSDVAEGQSGWQPIAEATDTNTASTTKIGELFLGKFAERNPFNIPGPFYGAMTDTCETGPAEAPQNVMLDPQGQEFVFRQPSNVRELQQVIGAAICDPFIGYGADGNSHWSLALVREWWGSRNELIEQSTAMCQPKERIERWRSYLANEAEAYLRAYAFFIEEGRLPSVDERLPDLG